MPSQAASTSNALAEHVAGVEAQSRRYETPCGAGHMIWRSWGSGRPVILLHGGSGSWTHWIKTIPALAERYTVWTPDMPGLGDSAMPNKPWTPEICGQVVAEGFNILFQPDAKPDLVAFSFGAHVGVFAAALLGDRLRSMTISGCAALGLSHFRPTFAKERSDMTGNDRDEVHRANLATLMIADPARIDPLAIHLQALNIAKARFRSRPFAGGDEIKRMLPSVRVPLRGLWGERDQIALPSVEARFAVLREHHPELITRVVPDAGHWAAYEQPEGFNKALLELLNSPTH